MPILRMKEIKKEFAQKNFRLLFIYEDYFQRTENEGLAKELRGLLNSRGIITKIKPSMDEDVFLKNDDFVKWYLSECSVLNEITTFLARGRTIVLPVNDLGTGLAKLPEKAPLIYNYLFNYFQLLEKTFGKDLEL